MKIRYFSDLHLDFTDLDPVEGDEDVVVLAGDAREGSAGVYWLAENFPTKVRIYTPGNHEFYHNYFGEMKKEIADACWKFNVKGLIQPGDMHVVDGVTFVGGTMWTDFYRSRSMAIHAEAIRAVTRFMNDYHCIYDFDHRIALAEHDATVAAIQEQSYAAKGKVVVVTHHAPSYKSVAKKYRSMEPNDFYFINAGYHSDLDEMIKLHDNIKLWIHGHTHSPFDYTIGQCRVVCNPRGYTRGDPNNTFENPEFDWNMTVEV